MKHNSRWNTDDFCPEHPTPATSSLARFLGLCVLVAGVGFSLLIFIIGLATLIRWLNT